MSSIPSQFAAGVQQAMSQLGTTATYRRADTGEEVSVNAVLAWPQYQVSDDGSVVLVAANRWDVMLVSADLAFLGTVYEPQPGDTLTLGDATYTVMIDNLRRYCWTWADKYQIRRRVFVKSTV